MTSIDIPFVWNVLIGVGGALLGLSVTGPVTGDWRAVSIALSGLAIAAAIVCSAGIVTGRLP